MANVVFSGTVKKVMADSPDDNKSSMYKGEIEIKRVFKGNDIVNEVANVFFDQVRNHKMVMVDGFGDPHICESKIHSGDTKIFMLNKGYNGELRLNSSIMPITLTNLEYTEAVVKPSFGV
ncbi:agrin-like [Littorina saxatilis]|uniref:agrin-like n=1 Tax=Littorina saxatilis TaxID=31220 RepID=UPI0038B5F21D